MHTTMDGSPPSCSSTAAVTPTGSCISPPSSTTEQHRDALGSPKLDSLCLKRPSSTKLKYSNRHMPYPEGSARSPGSCSSDGDSNHSDGEDPTRAVQSKVKRIAANSRERKRMHTVNSAFDQLRELVPTYPSNRKLSKIDTLRLACTYIQDLVSLLHNTQAIQGEDVLYHQPFPDGFNGYPVAVKQEMVDFPAFAAAPEHFRMQQTSCLRFASQDCPETFASSTSESDSCTHSPPQQAFMQCLPTSSVAVRPPPLTRASSEGSTSIHTTRLAEVTSTSGSPVVTSGASLPPPPPTAPAVQPTAASPSPVPSPPVFQRAPMNITSPLAMHSVQHSSMAPHLIHASLSHHTTPPVWNRPTSIPSPYPVYGQ